MSSDGFAAASQASKLISCDLTRSAVWINTSGDKTDVDVAYIVEGGAENQTDVGTMSLVREDGGWKIDAVSGLFHLF